MTPYRYTGQGRTRRTLYGWTLLLWRDAWRVVVLVPVCALVVLGCWRADQ